MWIISEFKTNKSMIRIILGLLTIAIVAYFSIMANSVIPYYEKQLHKSCIKKLEESIQDNNVSKAKEAINTYNKIVSETDNSYKAVMEMWNILTKKDK